METLKIVPQLQFASLEDFIENNNNFWGYMILDGIRSREEEPFYQRFVGAAPELAMELRQTMTMDRYKAGIALPWKERLPWDKLWEAYKIMSNLVYAGDPGVKGEDDANVLTR
jgi:hypothetical protein